MDNSQVDRFRNFFFIVGSNYSGKSLLGHMLAMNENCLYNYSSISPKKYFHTNGKLLNPQDEKLNELVNEIKKVSHFLSGGMNRNEEEKWLRSDKLMNYNYNKFQNDLIKLLDIEITIDNFYLYWDLCLQNCRLNGEKTDFTVFEIENIYPFIDILSKKIKKIKFVDILRKPIDQIKSQKADILFRGPKIGFTGALSSKNNVYLPTLNGILDQHKFNLSNKERKNLYKIELDKLRNISDNEATKLSKFLFDDASNSYKSNLIEASKFKIFKNRYIDFSASNRSYFLSERQQHHNIKITKENIMQYNFIHERYFYYFMNFIGPELNEKRKIKICMKIIIICILFPVLLTFTTIFGFKDLKRRNKFRKIMKLRYNCTVIIFRLVPKILLVLFLNLFDVKK